MKSALSTARMTHGKPLQDLDAALQRPVIDGVAEAEMGVAPAERVAGNDEKVVANRLGNELVARAPGRLDEKIERAAGPDELVAVLQGSYKPIALLLVIGDVGSDVAIDRKSTR